MYKIIPFSDNIDLTEFYEVAHKKGFVNNSNRKMLIDCFQQEKEKQVWILHYNNRPAGSVAAHSFDDVMDKNSYRIAVRTCVINEFVPKTGLRTLNEIVTHQNISSQFLIPTCINWAPKNSRLYITSNENDSGTQRLVHRIFCPAMEKTGQMKRVKDVFYRGTNQTVWELFPSKFFDELNKNKRWS
jgi:hypothetical protein